MTSHKHPFVGIDQVPSFGKVSGLALLEKANPTTKSRISAILTKMEAMGTTGEAKETFPTTSIPVANSLLSELIFIESINSKEGILHLALPTNNRETVVNLYEEAAEELVAEYLKGAKLTSRKPICSVHPMNLKGLAFYFWSFRFTFDVVSGKRITTIAMLPANGYTQVADNSFATIYRPIEGNTGVLVVDSTTVNFAFWTPETLGVAVVSIKKLFSVKDTGYSRIRFASKVNGDRVILTVVDKKGNTVPVVIEYLSKAYAGGEPLVRILTQEEKNVLALNPNENILGLREAAVLKGTSTSCEIPSGFTAFSMETGVIRTTKAPWVIAN